MLSIKRLFSLPFHFPLHGPKIPCLCNKNNRLQPSTLESHSKEFPSSTPELPERLWLQPTSGEYADGYGLLRTTKQRGLFTIGITIDTPGEVTVTQCTLLNLFSLNLDYPSPPGCNCDHRYSGKCVIFPSAQTKLTGRVIRCHGDEMVSGERHAELDSWCDSDSWQLVGT